MDFSFFTTPFVLRALIAGVLISLCAAILGVTLVLRRLSFMGDGLSHVAFGAMAVAGALGLAGVQMSVALPVTAICAVLLLRGGAKVQGDAALAMLSVGAMAAGYMMMNLYPSSSNVSGDVCSTLFGAVSILTLTSAETILCVALSIAVIIFHILTYHSNFDIAFDEDFARVSGAKASIYNLISAIVTAIVIVVSMRLVGALLVSALIVFPVVSAMRVAKSFRAVTLLATVIAGTTALAGIFIAVVAGTPIGATIVIVDAVTLLFFRSWRWGLALCLIPLAVISFVKSQPTPNSQLPSSLSPHHSSLITNHSSLITNHYSLITTIYPLYDWTLNIVGDRTNEVSVALLQNGGADLHSFQPTASDIRAIDNCDLFILVGGQSDAWAKKLSPRSSLPLIDSLPPRHFHHHTAHCDHENCHHSHHHETANCKPQTANSQGVDDHVWLSLRDASTCVAIIAERLAAIDPDGADVYRSNARAFSAAIRELDAEYADALSHSSGEPLVFADRFPFARLADDYSLDCVAAFQGCCADAEASFHTIAHLAGELDKHSLKKIYVLEQGDRRLAEAVRAATTSKDQEIRILDSMQSAPSTGYIETMRTNLRAFTD